MHIHPHVSPWIVYEEKWTLRIIWNRKKGITTVLGNLKEGIKNYIHIVVVLLSNVFLDMYMHSFFSSQPGFSYSICNLGSFLVVMTKNDVNIFVAIIGSFEVANMDHIQRIFGFSSKLAVL